MSGLLFDVFKNLLLKNTDVLKICRKSKFLGMKNRRNALPLKIILGKTFILALLSSAVFRLQNLSQISFKLFYSGDKRPLSEFLRK